MTAALMLALAAAPAAADAVSAESQPKRWSARARAGCAQVTSPVAIAPGYEGLYSHYANGFSGCSVVTNTGSLPLQFWSNKGGVIDAPVHLATPAGWAAETTARQIMLELAPDRVVVLPGEQAVLYQPPPLYTVDVVPLQVAQEAAFAEQYASLARVVAAERDEGRLIPLNNRFGMAINECAKATRGTWNELGKATGVESIADIFDQAKDLRKCKTAYDILDPSSTDPNRPSALDRWRQKLSRFNAEWNTQLGDNLAARLARALGQLR
ncbi:hypothetical protein [Streptomyces melanogenes]|uniref:hypothetical protein n=1 Tax=Streptomyces melanogenes TaxID=67326 RepID=UPI00378951CD